MRQEPDTLILASRSARRAELLRKAGVRFVQVAPPFEDPEQPAGPQGVAPETVAVELAAKKARSLIDSSHLEKDCRSVVLGADTVVVAQDGSLLGTPTNEAQAQEILQQLNGVNHHVVTGVAMLSGSGDLIDRLADRASVYLGALSSVQLMDYLASGRWRGKAGAYNLFEMQSQWRLTVQGDPATVVGLPMKALSRHLTPWRVSG